MHKIFVKYDWGNSGQEEEWDKTAYFCPYCGKTVVYTMQEDNTHHPFFCCLNCEKYFSLLEDPSSRWEWYDLNTNRLKALRKAIAEVNI